MSFQLSIDHNYCSEHSWRRRRPIKVDKKSIFYSLDQPSVGQRRRLQSSKPSKGTTGSSTTSIHSTNKKVHHRRKRRRRTARSKSRKRSSSVKLSLENTIDNPNDEQTPSSAGLDIKSLSDNELVVGNDDDDDDDDDDSIEIIGNQLAEMNCQAEQEQCDDSDSLDEALDAELLDDGNENNFI
ncbi:unnamed protein product [Rotaria magnacalcarata]|uniref:Uncharacterized protein n=1 Tax=Rotaria magnacalcarata TaxID=392030 RepID=A0A8S3A9G6_9BILA|nr:unnamed protein product [Rotaria magnacalcarata]